MSNTFRVRLYTEDGNIDSSILCATYFVTNGPVWGIIMAQKSILIPVASPGLFIVILQDYFLQGQKGDIVCSVDAHHDVNIHGISPCFPNTERLTQCRHSSLGIFLEDCLTQGQCGADLAWCTVISSCFCYLAS